MKIVTGSFADRDRLKGRETEVEHRIFKTVNLLFDIVMMDMSLYSYIYPNPQNV